MNRSLFSLALLLSCTPMALAAPQDASTPEPAAPADHATPNPEARPPLIPASELSLQYYTARQVNAYDLFRTIDGLATREFFVRNEDGAITGPVSNVRSFGDSNTLLIYDRPARIEEITKLLAGLEQAATRDPVPQAATFQTAEYVPRNVPLNGLYSSLRPFYRNVEVPASNSFQNVAIVEVPAHLVLRDTPDNVQQMLACLQRVDVPAPQLVMTCWLLRGTNHDVTAELPAELVDNLSRLVPFARFEQVSMALLRTSVVAGQEQELHGEFRSGDQDERFGLKLVPAGYDPESQSLTLERCRFESSTGQQFSTGAVMTVGEYVVLGAAGNDPLFVVLRVMPVRS